MARTPDARHDEQREARKAVAEAKHANTEARKLAKTLSRDARMNLEVLIATARADVRTARKELHDNPRRARRTAKRAAARLESASLQVTASGDARRKALADSDAKNRAKTIKRRRVQAERARKMARTAAFRTIVSSIAIPTDRDQAESDLSYFQHLEDRVAKRARH